MGRHQTIPDENHAKSLTEAKTEVDNHLAVAPINDLCRHYIEPAVMV